MDLASFPTSQSSFVFKIVFSWSLFDTKKWYFHQTFQLIFYLINNKIFLAKWNINFFVLLYDDMMEKKICFSIWRETWWCHDSRMSSDDVHKWFFLKTESSFSILWNFDFQLVTKIVLTYCEKKLIEKNFWNWRLKAENLQNFWDHQNNLFKQWKVRTISGNRMLF